MLVGFLVSTLVELFYPSLRFIFIRIETKKLLVRNIYNTEFP